MQDSKEIGLATDYRDASDADDAGQLDRESGLHSGDSADADGWKQYRKWISSAPATKPRRSSLDPALYTWKGYRNWTEQVKRNWSDTDA
jgi:hypothetical protein